MSVSDKTRSLLNPGGGCPAGYGRPKDDSVKEKPVKSGSGGTNEQEGINLMVETNGLSYGDYLQLDKILTAQTCQSEIHGELVHDEHLFIVIHQAYELWFKQVIFEIDSIRKIFQQDIIEEALMLEVNKRLQRVVMIAKHLADQVLILETMTPLDFMDFRDHLSTASGFQSLQFRLIENKLGVKSEHRVRYNRSNYRDVYKEKEKELEQLMKSEEDPSLFDLIERWLMRTPGTNVNDDFCFSKSYQDAINSILEESLKDIENESNPKVREVLLNSYKKKKEQYSSIFDQEKHDSLIARGERRLSFQALHGALMISLYREEPIFHLPHQVLQSLMDIDSLITKWRYNHVMLVQRMLGSSQIGTGGSSGYQYLRSTLSERYKVFLDLFNLSTFLIPRQFLPPLTKEMKRVLEGWRNNDN